MQQSQDVLLNTDSSTWRSSCSGFPKQTKRKNNFVGVDCCCSAFPTKLRNRTCLYMDKEQFKIGFFYSNPLNKEQIERCKMLLPLRRLKFEAPISQCITIWTCNSKRRVFEHVIRRDEQHCALCVWECNMITVLSWSSLTSVKLFYPSECSVWDSHAYKTERSEVTTPIPQVLLSDEWGEFQNATL